MEKITIGKRISTLRKAKGLTQKEFGRLLYVSDKTVSRWERDECSPELSLIPAIAKIFEITTDQLLSEGYEILPLQPVKEQDENQLKQTLYNKGRKHANLSLISLSISIAGLLLAITVNLGFSKGFLAFILAFTFCLASEICQICFTNSALIRANEMPLDKEIGDLNSRFTTKLIILSFVNGIIFAFCLPLATLIDGINFGMRFEFWCGYGLLFALIFFLLAYVIYALLIRNVLTEKNYITVTETKQLRIQQSNTLLKKVVAISLGVSLFIGIALAIFSNVEIGLFIKKQRFEKCEDFKNWIENDYENWYKQGYYIDKDGDVVISSPNVEQLPSDGKEEQESPENKVYRDILDSSGKVICTYYHNPDLYVSITFSENSDNKMPVTVITKEAYYNALDTIQIIKSSLYLLFILNVGISCLVYIIKIYQGNKIPQKNS